MHPLDMNDPAVRLKFDVFAREVESPPLSLIHILLLMSETLNLDAAFSALADPTRRAILARLAKGETTVMELAKPCLLYTSRCV